MNNLINYCGPDSEGFWVDTNDKIAFGHHKLSILDSNEAGHQLMHSDKQNS